MSRYGSPRVSEDSVILREQKAAAAELDLQAQQEYADYETKPLKAAFRDLERDVAQFREIPRVTLTKILNEVITEDPDKPLYFHLAFTAAYAPFSTSFCGPHGHVIVDLDFSLWQLTQPPLRNLRIGKVMLLRLVLINFWEHVVGEFYEKVEEIVKRKDAELHGRDEVDAESVDVGSIEGGSVEGGSVRSGKSGKSGRSLRGKIGSLFKKKAKKPWRRFDVIEVEHEAKRFADTELALFLRLFNFIVHLRIPSVEFTLLRYLDATEEDYVIEEDGNWRFRTATSWKKDWERRKRLRGGQEEGTDGCKSWWPGTGIELPVSTKGGCSTPDVDLPETVSGGPVDECSGISEPTSRCATTECSVDI